MDRFTAAHEKIHLMLLGSPPDMVHGIPSHRTRPFAHSDTLKLLYTINNNFTSIKYKKIKRVEYLKKVWYNILKL